MVTEMTRVVWPESRLGGGSFGVAFFGFLASRLRRSLFPMSHRMPRIARLWLENVQNQFCMMTVTWIGPLEGCATGCGGLSVPR